MRRCRGNDRSRWKASGFTTRLFQRRRGAKWWCSNDRSRWARARGGKSRWNDRCRSAPPHFFCVGRLLGLLLGFCTIITLIDVDDRCVLDEVGERRQQWRDSRETTEGRRPERLIRERGGVSATGDVHRAKVFLDESYGVFRFRSAEMHDVEAQSTRNEESGGAIVTVRVVPRPEVGFRSGERVGAHHYSANPSGEGWRGEDRIKGDALRVSVGTIHTSPCSDGVTRADVVTKKKFKVTGDVAAVWNREDAREKDPFHFMFAHAGVDDGKGGAIGSIRNFAPPRRTDHRFVDRLVFSVCHLAEAAVTEKSRSNDEFIPRLFVIESDFRTRRLVLPHFCWSPGRKSGLAVCIAHEAIEGFSTRRRGVVDGRTKET